MQGECNFLGGFFFLFFFMVVRPTYACIDYFTSWFDYKPDITPGLGIHKRVLSHNLAPKRSTSFELRISGFIGHPSFFFFSLLY